MLFIKSIKWCTESYSSRSNEVFDMELLLFIFYSYIPYCYDVSKTRFALQWISERDMQSISLLCKKAQLGQKFCRLIIAEIVLQKRGFEIKNKLTHKVFIIYCTYWETFGINILQKEHKHDESPT